MYRKILFEKNLPPDPCPVSNNFLYVITYVMVIHLLSIFTGILMHLQLHMNIDSFPHCF